ncbi:hypothetical protein [Trinickia soli]|uniref:Uncharacterized protein n=1 Tax=Trinickia soli TaxID=380675 RepID=A0A2N7WE23_9BURK|nr:hypothetical protein [Trinickia soli]PMS27686.1 hypothetical protein C0Z19_03165 [Trinickia soli]CAB3659247.1 hypothetical protein LMG24076_01361 [Trinickia soli]
MQQLTLTLIGGLVQLPLWFAAPKRHRRAKTGVFAPWRQLPLKLPIRKLIRKGSHFIWTRPDGRQFVCRTMRSLIARVMNYDGHLLQGLLKTAQR